MDHNDSKQTTNPPDDSESEPGNKTGYQNQGAGPRWMPRHKVRFLKDYGGCNVYVFSCKGNHLE